MPLTDYRSLGRSGLAVSPLALGTMTFGTARWGSDELSSRRIFDEYIDAGGNFVDTADVYADGRSEEMLGSFVRERNIRDGIVIATKAGFATGSGPNAGGSGAKHLISSVDHSLRRLQTDYIDMYWLHVWDAATPAEELLETMRGLVLAGKIRYWGLSNAPAWFAAKIATLAAVRGFAAPIALQYFYSLANRDIEAEHMPLAREFGLGVVPWSPLAFGLLSGKYDRAAVENAESRPGGLPRDAAAVGETRSESDKRLDGANPFGDSLFTEKNWAIVEKLKHIAAERGATPATVALAWVVGRAGVTSTLIGVSRIEQLHANIAALTHELTAGEEVALNAISAGEPRLIYGLLEDEMRSNAVYGGATVTAWGKR